MLALRCRPSFSYFCPAQTASALLSTQPRFLSFSSSSPSRLIPGFSTRWPHSHKPFFPQHHHRPLRTFSTTDSPISAVDDVLIGCLFGNNKATEVAHLVWKHVVRKGDIVIDATCGNGYDSLALLRMVADDSGSGCVYGLDIQEQALRNTSLLLDDYLTPEEVIRDSCMLGGFILWRKMMPVRQQVKLLPICHSRMKDVVPVGKLARLIAFNLGYLPGGKKSIITKPETTMLALEAAKSILAVGGIISIIVYVGHPGGRDEYAVVEDFASQLPMDEWKCSKHQLLNRPSAPILIFIFRK